MARSSEHNAAYPQWIDEFADALYANYQNHDVNAHMPFNGWDFYPIFSDLWVDKINTAVRAFNDKKLRISEYVHSLPNHASVKFKPAEFVLFFKTAQTRPEIVREIMDFMVELLKVQNLGEPLWTNNKIALHGDIPALLKQVQPIPADREFAGEIGKLITGCATLTHGLYNDWCCDVSYDVYGPYETNEQYGDGTKLLVRSFADLSPVALWPDREFPVKEVQIYSIYKDVEFQTQLVSCATIAQGSLLDNLLYTHVGIDDRPIVTKEDLRPFRESILKFASELYVEYMDMGFEKQKELWLSQLGYQFKPLFDLVEQDWKPSEEMLQRVKGKELVPTIESYQVPRDQFEDMFGISYLKHAYTK